MDPAHAHAERLAASRPFSGRVDLREIAPIHGDSAHSGSAFFATDAEGRRYKLRDCGHVLRAASLERWIRLVPFVFPKLLARQGRLLLLEVLEDFRPMTRVELILRAAELGRLGARVHRASAPGMPGRLVRAGVSLRFARRFAADLRLLEQRGLLSAGSRAGALRKFGRHRQSFGLPVALELDDLHKANWMIRESDGELRYVDEEGVGLRPKGMGLASLLKTATRTHTWHLYRDGYDEVGDASFLSFPYTEYLLLIDTVRRVAHKVRTEARPEKLPDELGHLRAMADTSELSLDWRFPKGDS